MQQKRRDDGTDATILYYEQNADAFLSDTADADLSSILCEFVAFLPQGASVLDWGCGSGRDSRAMLDMGYSVVSVDASPAMCAVAENRFGIQAVCEGFEELDVDGAYDGIWACSSLLHVKKVDLPAIFTNAHRALKQGGVLYASFKYGDFEGLRNGRWFTDLDEESLTMLLQPSFDVVRMWVTRDVRVGRGDERWLNCLAANRS